jgi:hypothetical protein
MNGLRNTFFVYGAPALLCVIAGLQIYFAHTASLSPWKGGGFGMFSTVDSPAARFLRVYLVTDDEEVPVLLPSGLSASAQEARTIPTRGRLRSIAEGVARGEWVPYRLDSAAERYRDLISRYEGVPDSPRQDAHSPADADRARPAEPIEFGNAKILRMLERGERASPVNPPVEFRSVRAEVWMIKFDAQTSQMRATKFLEVTVERAGEEAAARPRP